MAYIVTRTLEALEGLEHLDQLDWAKNVGVLRGDLNHCLQILADVDTEHLVEASHRLFSREPTEVVDEPL